MSTNREAFTILMADDDRDDSLLTKLALEESCGVKRLYIVEDGEALLNYLFRKGDFFDPKTSPRPDLILLDLNMPRLDGREALRVIKSDPDLRTIPILIFTTSEEEADIIRSYEDGASSFISKPATFDGLLGVMRALGNFWFESVTLPSRSMGSQEASN